MESAYIYLTTAFGAGAVAGILVPIRWIGAFLGAMLGLFLVGLMVSTVFASNLVWIFGIGLMALPIYCGVTFAGAVFSSLVVRGFLPALRETKPKARATTPVAATTERDAIASPTAAGRAGIGLAVRRAELEHLSLAAISSICPLCFSLLEIERLNDKFDRLKCQCGACNTDIAVDRPLS